MWIVDHLRWDKIVNIFHLVRTNVKCKLGFLENKRRNKRYEKKVLHDR